MYLIGVSYDGFWNASIYDRKELKNSDEIIPEKEITGEISKENLMQRIKEYVNGSEYLLLSK